VRAAGARAAALAVRAAAISAAITGVGAQVGLAEAQLHREIGRPADAEADAADYDAASGAWNGLSTLVELATGAGLEVRAVAALDWDDLEQRDLLLLLYPTHEIDANHLAAFLRNGGSVILGDDFGVSKKALTRLGILRDEAFGVGAAHTYDDLPFTPIALPRRPDHPLARGVAELVTNHPAILTQIRGPEVIFAFGEGEAVVVAGELGAGRFVILSDPSVLINDMLLLEGNFEFALNLLRFFATPPSGDAVAPPRLTILAGDFRLLGVPSLRFDDGTFRGSVANTLRDLDMWLEELNEYLLADSSMRALAAVAALALALLAAVLLPLRRRAELDGAWIRATPYVAGAAPQHALDLFALVERYDHARPRANYLLPAAIVRDSVAALLEDRLGVADPLAHLRAPELLDQVEARLGASARAEVAAIHASLRATPTRAQAAAAWRGRTVTQREFDRLYEHATRLLNNADRSAAAELRVDPGGRPGGDRGGASVLKSE
jgi:hypothetical protein